MNLKATTNVETNKYKLEISVGNPEWSNAVSKTFNKKNKSIQIPGFRKGKAPRNVIEKMYGENFFYEDAINLIYSDIVEQAVEEAKLDVVDKHNIDFDLIKADKEGIDFSIIVTTRPEVKLKDYKGISVEKDSAEITEEDIEAELKRVCEGHARMIEITDRATVDGDTVVIDFEGFKDGVPFEGGKAEAHTLVLGSNSFIPGFEEQLINHTIDEKFDINVTFPEDYHAEDLKAQSVVFKIKIHEIKAKELPAIDDEFAKDASEFDTLAEYKADLSKKLLDRKTIQIDAEYEESLITQITENMECEIPQVMIDYRIEDNIKEFSYRLQSQGLDLKTYLQFTGGNEAEFKATFEPQAEKQVKARLALEEIVKLENIVISDEEIEVEYAKLAEAYKTEIVNIKAAINAESITSDLACNKAVEIVKDNAKVSTKSGTSAKATDKTAKTAVPKSKDKEEPKAAAKTEPKKETKTTAAKKKPQPKKDKDE